MLVLGVFSLVLLLSESSKGMRAVVQEHQGGPDTLRVDPSVDIPTPGKNQILMKVVYTAINRADTLQRKGSYPVPPSALSNILGLEASGFIEAVGDDCSREWNKGDRVMALLNGGGYAEFVLVYEGHVMPVPDGLTLKDAAAIPEVWLTAFQLLHFLAHLQPTEDVLIHAGGSGVGTAATQLVTHHGARAIVTAGSAAKIQRAKELGASAGYNYKEQDFAEEVLKFTDNKGVNVILDCVGGSHAEKNLKSLAMDSRWILYGLMGGATVQAPILGGVLRKRVSLIGTTLRGRSDEYKTGLVEDFTNKILPSFQPNSDKKLIPIIDTVFDLEDVVKAHEYMESNKSIGKILLKVADEGKGHQEL